MATEYHRLGLAQALNPAAFRASPGADICDLFDRPETVRTSTPGEGGRTSASDGCGGSDGDADWTDGAETADRAGQGALVPHPSFEAKAEIWREFREGRISMAEAQRRSAKIGVLSDEPRQPIRLMHGAPGKPRPPVARPREDRSEPNDSRQYTNPMATTAARDDRLTPQAKALLQIIRARAGKGTQTTTTKGTLAAILNRSTRSITRYLRDLERCGYLQTRIRADTRGFHLGLALTITEKVLPFFSEMKKLAKWLGESAGLKPVVPFMPFATSSPGSHASWTPRSKASFSAQTAATPVGQGVTLLSFRNQIHNDSSPLDSNGLRRFSWAAPTDGA